MPDVRTMVSVVVAVAVLVLLATIADWFIANPGALIVLIIAIGGGGYLHWKNKQARTRV